MQVGLISEYFQLCPRAALSSGYGSATKVLLISLLQTLQVTVNRVPAGYSQVGFAYTFFMGLVFLVVGYFVSHAFINAYTSSAAASSQGDLANWDLVAQYGGDYLTICTCCSMGFFSTQV